MADLIIAVPNKDMYAQAMEVAREQEVDAHIVLTTSASVVADVMQLATNGTPVVIARGNHARLLREQTQMTVVEIVLSGQEMALLTEAVCKLTQKDGTRVAFIGFPRMFSDPTPFAHVFKADIRIYTADDAHDVEQAVAQAIADGADVIVGGETAVEHAQNHGCAALFLSSTTESIATALRTAKRVRYGIAMENKRAQEFLTLLNYSFDAIIKLDQAGNIILANYMAESIFHKPAGELIGRSVFHLFDVLPGDPLRRAVELCENAYSLIVRTQQEAYVANLAVLSTELETQEFILSMQAFNQINKLEETVRIDRLNRGYIAKHSFDDLSFVSPLMRQAKQNAMRYADFDLPVLICGPYGMEPHLWAEAIHNASGRRDNPFVRINLAHSTPEMQRASLMSVKIDGVSKSVFENAYRGTLLIENADLLTDENRVTLMQLISNGTITRPESGTSLPVDVRVICTTSKDLRAMATQGLFPPPLYYGLAQLDINLPGLNAHPEDIPIIIAEQMERLCRKYRRFATLSPKAQAILHAHTWHGNIQEIAAFLEKAFVLMHEREIDAELVSQLLAPYQTEQEKSVPPPAAPVLYSVEEAQLKDALHQTRGNRTQCAELLGISKVTLWRRMKKHGMIQ